jgi:hypothetical protein
VLVWDIIRQLRVGEHGVAYALDAQDRVIGHSDMFRSAFDTAGNPILGDFSLFRRDFSGLAQVQAAHAPDSTQAHAARDITAAMYCLPPQVSRPRPGTFSWSCLSQRRIPLSHEIRQSKMDR